MGNLIIKVTGFILLKTVVFFIFLVWKGGVEWNWGNLKTGEDWFYFLWLFFVPIAIEVVLFAYPFSYGLSKIANTQNKLPFYALFLGLFLIEFIFSNWLYGIQSSLLKVSVSLILFLLLFWRRLF